MSTHWEMNVDYIAMGYVRDYVTAAMMQPRDLCFVAVAGIPINFWPIQAICWITCLPGITVGEGHRFFG